MRRVQLRCLLVAGLLVAGCAPTLPTAPTGEKAKASRKAPATDKGDTSETTLDDEAQAPAESYYGRVLGLDGAPAVNVEVKGYFISNNGAGLVSDRGASFRVLADALSTRTDENGEFTLAHPEGQALNIEAVQKSDVKAIRLAVAAGSSGLTLQLAPTGTVSGKVTSSSTAVSDFEGTDVYIPGTSYLAKAAKDGSYTISQVPAGAFTLVANKSGLGKATASNVAVVSGETTTAPDLALSVTRPTITGVSPANAGAGAEVTISGEHFGATAGELLAVSFGGVQATNPQRVNDTTIKAIVPSVTGAGAVTVSVGGISSEAAPFSVIKAITLTSNTTDVRKGGTRSYTAVAVDTQDQAVASPVLSWKTSSAAATVDAAGQVTGVSEGAVTLTVESGGVKASLPLRVLTTVAEVETLAGSGREGGDVGTGDAVEFYGLSDMASDGAGNLYVSSYATEAGYTFIQKVTPAGVVSNVSLSPDGVAAASNRFTNWPGLATDGDGNVVIVDGGRVRVINASGALVDTWTFSPAFSRTGLAVAVAEDGSLYVADNVAVYHMPVDGSPVRIAGHDSERALADGDGDTARFAWPSGLALDGAGHLFVSDSNNHRIRMIDLNKARTDPAYVTTLAGSGESGYEAGGHADGSGAEARFNRPSGIVFAPDGFLYVSDNGNHRVRRVSVGGAVTTVAGTGAAGYVDGTGLPAQFNEPGGMAVDAAGRLVVADSGNWRLRRIKLVR